MGSKRVGGYLERIYWNAAARRMYHSPHKFKGSLGALLVRPGVSVPYPRGCKLDVSYREVFTFGFFARTRGFIKIVHKLDLFRHTRHATDWPKIHRLG